MSNEMAIDLTPIIKIYKDGRVERLRGNARVDAGVDPKTGVESTDVVISPETGRYIRLYIPNPTTESTPQKKPLLVYFHGGTYLTSSAADPYFHNYLNSLAASANVVIVSVDYRIGPEQPLPAAFEDSWSALKWIASSDSDKWLSPHADRGRLFMAGDGAGANLSHHMALKYGLDGGVGGEVKLIGIVLVIPYFWGSARMSKQEEPFAAITDGLWRLALPTAKDMDDPIINPENEPTLGKLGCEKVLICLAEKDWFKARGLLYAELLKKSGWGGDLQVHEIKGVPHNFYLDHPETEQAAELMKIVSDFFRST